VGPGDPRQRHPRRKLIALAGQGEGAVAGLTRRLAWLAGAIILLGCGALISIDVVTRAIFRRGMVESFELSGYALAAAVGLGAAFTVTSKSNIRVDIALDLLPRGVRRGFDLLAALALAVTAVALAWFCFGTLAQSHSMDAKSVSTLQTPMVIPQGIWWAGLAWFALVAVLWPLLALRRWLAGDARGFDAAVGSLRVEEEISQSGAKRAE
jgi:TRAP-type C4-dicarboxylate transport system permease small subunit